MSLLQLAPDVLQPIVGLLPQPIPSTSPASPTRPMRSPSPASSPTFEPSALPSSKILTVPRSSALWSSVATPSAASAPTKSTPMPRVLRPGYVHHINRPHRLAVPRPPLTGRPPSAPIRARQLTLLDPVRNDAAAVEQALAFIKHARPVVLSVAVDADVPDADFVERLREVCGGDGVAGYDGVRFLELVLSGCRSLARVESWMVSRPSVRPLSLVLFRLCMRPCSAPRLRTRIHPSSPPSPSPSPLLPPSAKSSPRPPTDARRHAPPRPPLAGLALLSSTRATFPTPRPTPFASPLSSPPLGPSSPASPSAVDTLALDADAETPTMETMYGAPRRAPPGVEALARAVRGALPGLRYLGLAPCGPAEGRGRLVRSASGLSLGGSGARGAWGARRRGG
ncbi:uncharacterized protein B0H18DRAFT_1131511 [Fomitopsis serialis]|uniref:uncharacterized protein n=1 Tax=Fomitopsis serialis TaxID=139415 RepID=UPI002007FE11|nr:uncharacterized protein B0H18DRAFT_1131511 [Neoantrodia serialis]KAH9907671.1 hypothetical protein B0H18DRAFT_1131511 [Neoantrodia serialis]